MTRYRERVENYLEQQKKSDFNKNRDSYHNRFMSIRSKLTDAQIWDWRNSSESDKWVLVERYELEVKM